MFVISLLLRKIFTWNSEYVFTIQKASHTVKGEIWIAFFFQNMHLFWLRLFILYQVPHCRALTPACIALVLDMLELPSACKWVAWVPNMISFAFILSQLAVRRDIVLTMLLGCICVGLSVHPCIYPSVHLSLGAQHCGVRFELGLVLG